MNKLIFLGGTCGKNNWRDNFICKLFANGVSLNQIFNPVVPDWNEEAQKREEDAKKNATSIVFYLANPLEEGNSLSAYSMVEATIALYDSQKTTVVIFDNSGMPKHATKALNQTEKVLRTRFPDANIFNDLEKAIEFLSK